MKVENAEGKVGPRGVDARKNDKVREWENKDTRIRKGDLESPVAGEDREHKRVVIRTRERRKEVLWEE